MRYRLWALALLGLAACDDGAEQAMEAPEACLEGDLIAQCPPGSNPILGATADGLCQASGGADLMNMQGHVTGRCYGEGACVVACQFAASCPCGVDAVTVDGVFCIPCEDVNPCGDGECAGGETPQSCPEDCAGDCNPGEMRCQGAAIESCNLRGRWEAIACPRGELCEQMPGQAPICRRDGIIVGNDMGPGDVDMGPRISGRIQSFDAPVPEIAAVVRPGDGRDVTPLGHFGLLRRCSGNDVRQAQCRQAISEHTRYRAVGRLAPEAAGFVFHATVTTAGALWLWGSERILAFGYDGEAPDFGEMPSLEEFCRYHAPTCADTPDADCVDDVPQATRDAYAGFRSAAAMRCHLAEAPENCSVSDACAGAERLQGYGPDQDMRGVLDGVHSTDGTLFAFWADDTHVALYDVEAQSITPIGDTGAYTARGIGAGGIAISADNRFIGAVASIAEGNAIAVVWSTAGGAPVAAIPLDFGTPTETALSPDGSAMAVMLTVRGRQETPAGVELINVAEQARAYRILPLDAPNPPNRNCFPHVGGGLAFSPRGDVLAVGAPAINGAACERISIVELWSVAGRAQVGVLNGPAGTSSVVRFSPDGSTIAVGSQAGADADVRVWDVDAGALVAALTSPSGLRWGAGVDGMEYSPDGRVLSFWGAGGVEDFTTMYVGLVGAAELAPPPPEEEGEQ